MLVDRSQSLFYFVPQDSHSQAGSTNPSLHCSHSSRAKHGGAYISAPVLSKMTAITGEAIENPHTSHGGVGLHLARTFGPTGDEQPSPPLPPAAAAEVLAMFLGQSGKISQIGFLCKSPVFVSPKLIFCSML